MYNACLGEIALFAFDLELLEGWAPCAGQVVPISGLYEDNYGISRDYSSLFPLIGNTFGGDGISTFALPDYRDLAPQGMHYSIANYGIYPTEGRSALGGEITIFPFNTPPGWTNCDGRLLPISQNESLFQSLGTRFAGDGETTFGVPDLTHTPPLFPHGALTNEDQEKETVPGLSHSTYSIANLGGGFWATPFLCEVKLFPTTVAPEQWAACSGQLLPISANTALFSLMGTTFGGDGETNFALPDLREVPLPSGVHYFIATEGVFPVRE